MPKTDLFNFSHEDYPYTFLTEGSISWAIESLDTTDPLHPVVVVSSRYSQTGSAINRIIRFIFSPTYRTSIEEVGHRSTIYNIVLPAVVRFESFTYNQTFQFEHNFHFSSFTYGNTSFEDLVAIAVHIYCQDN